MFTKVEEGRNQALIQVQEAKIVPNRYGWFIQFKANLQVRDKMIGLVQQTGLSEEDMVSAVTGIDNMPWKTRDGITMMSIKIMRGKTAKLINTEIVEEKLAQITYLSVTEKNMLLQDWKKMIPLSGDCANEEILLSAYDCALDTYLTWFRTLDDGTTKPVFEIRGVLFNSFTN